MIEKLKTINPYDETEIDMDTNSVAGLVYENTPLAQKINELVDAVNAIQKEREAERFEIQEWIGILEAVRKSVNVHEKQIDELQMKLEPEKCEAPAENVQDKFAEQRRWIGKLCRFWDTDIGENVWGILGGIDFSEIFKQRAEQSRRLGCRLVDLGAGNEPRHIFLDELPENAVGRKPKSCYVECGIFCTLGQQ